MGLSSLSTTFVIVSAFALDVVISVLVNSLVYLSKQSTYIISFFVVGTVCWFITGEYKVSRVLNFESISSSTTSPNYSWNSVTVLTSVRRNSIMVLWLVYENLSLTILYINIQPIQLGLWLMILDILYKWKEHLW